MTTALARYLLPDTASAGADGRLSVGGVDLVDLAEERGTPLFVYDEAHLRARCREAVDAFGPGVAYGVQGVPVPGHGPARPRGGHAPRRGDGGRAARGPRRRRAARAARRPRQQQVGGGAAAGPRARRAGGGRLLRRDRQARAAPQGGRAAHGGDGAGHPRGRGPHPRVRHDRPGRLQVRLRAGQRRRRPGGRADRVVAGVRPGRAARPHRQPDLPAPLLREGGGGPGRVRGPARPAGAVPGRGTGRALRRGRGRSHHRPVGQGAPGRLPGRRHRPPG